jgi:hypothetical protein
MQQVRAVSPRISVTLLAGQDLRAWQVQPELVGKDAIRGFVFDVATGKLNEVS